jgi:uncharacterized protein YdeI (BOF family)
VKNIISARVLGGMAAIMLVVASFIGLNSTTDTAEAAATGKINLVNNWSKLSTNASPAKLDATYGGTTPSYVGAGKSLYATYTSTGRHVMSGSNQLVIEVVDSDLNAAIVKSTVVVLRGDHSSSTTLVTDYQEDHNQDGINDYAIPIIDTNSDGVITGADLSFACRWIGEGYEDENGTGSTGIGTAFYQEAVTVAALGTADSLLDGTSVKGGATGATAANILTDATASTVALGNMIRTLADGMNVGNAGVATMGHAALMGHFNEAPKCSTTTSSLISLSVGNAGQISAGNNVSAAITVQTGSSALAGTLEWCTGKPDPGAQTGAGCTKADNSPGTTQKVAGLIQWKTSRVNTTTAKVWSGVVSSSNAINVLLTETGRNTGVFNGIVNVFDNENTQMPLGMALNNSADTTNGTTTLATAYYGSFGNTNAEAPCKAACATGAGRAGSSQTSTLAVKDGGTVYARYVDALDADSNTAQNRDVTAKIDATVPTVTVNSPIHSSENQTRTPAFSITATEAASGLDVSGALLVLQEGSETDNGTGEDGSVGATNGIDVMVTSALHDATGNDVGKGGNWLTSSIHALTGGDITLSSSTGDDSTSRTASSVTVNRGTSADGVSTLTYTYTPSVALPLGATTPVDHWIDFQAVATDLSGNVAYSDSSTAANAGVLNKFGAHHIKIDQSLPSISAAYTGWWWDTSIAANNKTHKHTSTKANSLVVVFDGNVKDIDATDFQITFDDGTTHTPTTAEMQTSLPTMVFLTLGASMPASDTPKVALAGSISDIAGNATSTGSLAGATDKMHPTVTATLSGGSGTGTAAGEGVNELTKTTMVLTVTTDEELVSNPKVDVYDLGMAKAGADNSGATTTGYAGPCGAVSTCGFGASMLEIDDYNIRTLVTSTDPPTESFVTDANGAGRTPTSSATVDATSAGVILDAAMTAQGTKTFKYTISSASGTPGTDGAKTVVVTAKDKATSANIRIHGSISSTTNQLKFTLDDTAPSLSITPADKSTTTQTKPYIVIDYSTGELSKVNVNTATLDGADITSSLSTTDNKKFYYVPTSALGAGSHTIVAKATDIAGNAATESTKTFTVASRSDFKLSLLAGWNSKSVPSDPVNPAIDSVFSNSGVDMVLAYVDHSWVSATKDSGSGSFVGSLSEIHSGHGYWVHNNNFESQAVALVGPVEPSAGSPPAVVTIPTSAGWNFVGVTDVSRANTEGNDGTTITTQTLYFGDLTDSTAGGHDIVYSYNTTTLSFVEVASGTNVSTGQGLWIYIVPESDGSILPIVPPSP